MTILPINLKVGGQCIELISVHLSRARHGRTKQKGASELSWTCIGAFGSKPDGGSEEVLLLIMKD